MNNIEIKVILPAKLIPDGSSVTKVNGQYEYTLRDCLRIYPEKESGVAPIIVKAEKGTKFLVAGNSVDHMSAICGDKELVWQTDLVSLRVYLDRKMKEMGDND